VSVKDVNQHDFVKAFAAFLKKLVIILYSFDYHKNSAVEKSFQRFVIFILLEVLIHGSRLVTVVSDL